MTNDFHALRVRALHTEADDALVLSFEVPPDLRAAFAFQPGQHLTLRRRAGGTEQRRSYSICGDQEGELRIGVRKVPGGAFSTWLHEAVHAGDSIEVMAPQGRFGVALGRERGGRYLAVTGGSGITPVLAMIKATLARDPVARFTLVYGNRSPRTTMFKEELEDLKNRYLGRLALYFLFSREHTDLDLNAGRMTRAKMGEFLGPVIDPSTIDQAFVCGPHEVNDEVEQALLAAGIPQQRIHVERFGVPAASATVARTGQGGGTADDEAACARVVIIRDGLRRELRMVPGSGSIVEAAGRAGLDVPYSCKSGVCCTCRARLLEGQVRMDRNFALEKQEVEDGYILTCQAHPLTDTVVVSYDDR